MDSGMEIPSECKLSLMDGFPEYTNEQKIGIIRQLLACFVIIF